MEMTTGEIRILRALLETLREDCPRFWAEQERYPDSLDRVLEQDIQRLIAALYSVAS